MDSKPPVYVVAAAGQWAVMSVEDGAEIEVFDVLDDALEAARSLSDVADRPMVFRDDERVEVGRLRWLDAAVEETTAIDGVRFDADTLWHVAAGLNARRRGVPIDGGPPPPEGAESGVHASAADSGTPANGWARAGVVVVDESVETHLYLEAELMPHIAREVDSGRLAYGSIHIATGGVDDDGVPLAPVLESHALTNRPLGEGLMPSTGLFACRSQPTRRIKTMAKKYTLRGAAAEKLAEVGASLGIELAEEMESDSYISPIADAVQKLHDAAAVEAIVEGSPPLDVSEAEAARAADDEEEDETGEKMLAVGRAILGKPEADAESVLAELGAQVERLAAALVDEDEAAGDDEKESYQAARAKASAEAGTIALRARLDSLEASNKKLTDRIKREETTAWLRGEIEERGLAEHVSAERSQKLLDIALRAGRDVVTESLDAAGAGRPPVGRVIPATRSQVPGRSGPSELDAAKAAVRSANPKMREIDVSRAALRSLKKNKPGVVAPNAATNGTVIGSAG